MLLRRPTSFPSIRGSRSFETPADASLNQLDAVLTFWGSCGFSMQTCGEGRFGGSRGSWWGNLTSFDIRRLKSRLQVVIVADHVSVDVVVNGFGQIITDYNRAYLALELAEFESVMSGQGRLNDAWQELILVSRKSFWSWSLSLGAKGHELDDQAKDILSAVGARLNEVRTVDDPK